MLPLYLWWWPAWLGFWGITIREADIIPFPMRKVRTTNQAK